MLFIIIIRVDVIALNVSTVLVLHDLMHLLSFLATSCGWICCVHIKGTPRRSGRVTQLKRNFSETCIFLLPMYLVYQNLFVVP